MVTGLTEQNVAAIMVRIVEEEEWMEVLGENCLCFEVFF